VLATAHAEKVTDAAAPELRRRFVEAVREIVEGVPGLGFPAERPVPWDRWDAAKRRLAAA
jgi:hypothetical protein